MKTFTIVFYNRIRPAEHRYFKSKPTTSLELVELFTESVVGKHSTIVLKLYQRTSNKQCEQK